MATPVLDPLSALKAWYAAGAPLISAIPAPVPPPTPSPDGTAVTAVLGGSIVDGAGNVWMLVTGNRGNDAPPQMISLNGTTVPSGAVILLLYFSGIIYQENSAHNWWRWVNGTWASTGDPRNSAIVPPYLNDKGFTFTKKTYEFMPHNALMGGLDINFNREPGHAWYPYPWWGQDPDNLSPSNFNFDPSDGALLITPGASGGCSIESFQNIPAGGRGTINGNGFVGDYAFELDWHPNNGSGFWSMCKSHVGDNIPVDPKNPLTYIAEMDWVECISGGINPTLTRQLIPTSLHRNTDGISNTSNEGDMANPATFFATMPGYPNGKPFNATRHTFGGVHVKGKGFWVFVDGVLVNSFTGKNYYDSSPVDYGLFLDYSPNYMGDPPHNNPDPAQLRLYRLTIYT